MPAPELDVTATAPPPTPAAMPALPAESEGGELPAGLRLDHFRIDKKLGAGGMGEVYLATDLALDRPVAIKVLPAGSSSGSARERLIREARAQARVHHANVAHIYFVGEDQGRLYFAMEYIAGKTLADQLAAGPMPVEEALATIRAAALGLREAQRAGFTHRDVKPSNLMVDHAGTVKVVDFGLVAVAPQGATDAPVQQTSLAGTPLYMAPEQAVGDPVDLRADIYALGATLYHLVTGKPPFTAETAAKLATLHRSAVRPGIARKGLPRTQVTAIDALVARMMAPDPADRFASYDELLRALDLASAQHTRPAGFWVRSIALLLDFVLVLVACELTKQPIAPDRDLPLGLVVWPIMGVLVALCLWRFGATPGKALFELEVIDVETGRRPPLRKALVRTLVLGAAPVGFSLISHLAAWLTGHGTVEALANIATALSFLALALVAGHAVLRVPGKRPPWDRVAGTLVRYRTGQGSRTLTALLR